MGQVVPFIARVRDSGDWTAAERARLQEVADHLSAGGVHVEVIFGATDEGDPWCVVTDGAGDVLIHVARIDGKFVVHSAVDDAVNEGVDLHAALRDQLDATEAAVVPQSATILPFGLTARQGQTFLALVAAAAFFYETSGVAGTAEAAELPPELPSEPAPPPPEDETPTQERELATQGATLQPQQAANAPHAAAILVGAAPDNAPPAAPHEAEAPPVIAPRSVEAAVETPAPKNEVVLSAPRAEAPPTVIRGTDADDQITGTAADEHIIGGAGNDTLRGGGGHDLLEGGAGDDRIELTSGTTAIGGAGADTFVIQAPVQLGHADTLLGVVLDFSALDGDKLTAANGRVITLPARPAPDDKATVTTTPEHGGDGDRGGGGGGGFTGQGVDPTHPTLTPPDDHGGDFGTTLVGRPLTRVEIDLNGDGVMDGYVLLGRNGHLVGGDDSPVVVTGQSFGTGDLFG